MQLQKQNAVTSGKTCFSDSRKGKQGFLSRVLNSSHYYAFLFLFPVELSSLSSCLFLQSLCES